MSAQPEHRVTMNGARCSLRSDAPEYASIEVLGRRIARISTNSHQSSRSDPSCARIDLGGYLLLPGFINAHDHLQYSLFPRLGTPPYRSYLDWGEDIHNRFAGLITNHRNVPKDVRLWWGGIRNLLCGVTTVCHHDPLWTELLNDDFPVRVVREFGWAHSLALGGDLHQARAATPSGRPFIIHALEGVDQKTRRELQELDRLGLLDANTVLVHGLALDRDGAALMRRRRASLVICPSSNKFLFERMPDMSLLGSLDRIALGNDSPLTALGDLLDEVRLTMRYCRITSHAAFRMITAAPAAILHLTNCEGSIAESGIADLIAIRDTGQDIEDRLQTLSMHDVELVMIGGQLQLASPRILRRLPSQMVESLEPLRIDNSVRWLRAPVKSLLQRAEAALGEGELHLGYRKISIPSRVEAGYVG